MLHRKEILWQIQNWQKLQLGLRLSAVARCTAVLRSYRPQAKQKHSDAMEYMKITGSKSSEWELFLRSVNKNSEKCKMWQNYFVHERVNEWTVRRWKHLQSHEVLPRSKRARSGSFTETVKLTTSAGAEKQKHPRITLLLRYRYSPVPANWSGTANPNCVSVIYQDGTSLGVSETLLLRGTREVHCYNTERSFMYIWAKALLCFGFVYVCFLFTLCYQTHK